MVKQASMDYVKDGLVFWLDGTDASASEWVDRVGGMVFTMHNIQLVTNGGVKFAGNNTSYGHNPSTYNYGYNTHTIEVVCDLNGEKQKCLIASTLSGTVCFGLYGGNGIFTGNGTQQKNWRIPSYYGIHVYSTYADKFYRDKTELTNNALDSFGIKSGGTYLGVKGSDMAYLFNGTIYQIRIYNRHLTEEEILYNQTIDINRYSI